MAIVRHHPRADAWRPAELAPGELVWAIIINGIENPFATGKARPVILIEAQGSQWKSMGLTTRCCYCDGSPRVAVPNPAAVGLKGQGWLWGRPCWVSALDIESHIGWVDAGLAFEIARLSGIEGPTLQTLLAAARKHHPPKPPVPLGPAGEED